MPAIPSETAHLIPTPDTVLWRYGGDIRLMAGAGASLVLQVAHPTVAAGVREHSDYAREPWGRLLRTLDYVYLMTYGGAEVATHTGQRLREVHTQIRGVAPDGRRYHALEPEAFAWVHATLVHGIVIGHRHFGRPLGVDNVERLYADWRALGRVIGIRDTDLPNDWAGFQAYFEQTVDERLEDSDVVQGVVSTLRRPAPPPLPLLDDRLWRGLRLPLGRLSALATIGLLPARLRTRLDLRLTSGQERELTALCAISRALTPALPARLRIVGPTYLRWRRGAIARGEFAPPPSVKRELVSA